VPIRIHELLLEQARVHLPAVEDGPVPEPQLIERLSASGSWHEQLELDQLELTLPDLSLAGQGHWQLSEPHDGELTLRADYRLDDDTRQLLEARISGRLDTVEINFEAEGPVRASGLIVLEDLPGEPRLSLELTGAFEDWPGLELSAHDLEVSASGNLAGWQANVSGRLEGMALPDNHLTAELRGSMQEIEIKRLIAQVYDGEVVASGRVHLDPDLAAELIIDLDRIDLTSLYPEWPQQARINGRLDVAADTTSVRLNQLQLSAPPTSLSLTGSGAFDLERDEVSLNLNWRDLTWPPVTDDTEPLLTSQRGTIRLTGALSDWQMELEAMVAALNQPVTSVEASARGNEDQAVIERLQLDAGPAGNLDVSGQVRWAPDFGGSAQLSISQANPGHFIPELRGQVNARMDIRFDSLADLSLEVHDISGQLRDQPLSGSGSVTISEEQPESGLLNLALGDNRLAVNSGDGQNWQWQLEAEALQQLWPTLDGQLQLEGDFNPFEQALSLAGEIRSGAFDEITVEHADINAEVSWQDPPRAAVNLNLTDLDLNPWERIERLDLSLDGGCDNHDLRLELVAERGNLNLAVNGALPDCLNDGQTWSGAVEQLSLTNTIAGDWALNRAMAVEVSPELITAQAGCLVESVTREGRICLRSLSIGSDSSIDLGIEQVPMDLVLLPMDPMFNLTNQLSGELSAAWNADIGLQRLGGHLALGPGALQPRESDRQLLVIESVRLDLEAPDAGEDNLLVTLEAILEGDSRLRGQALVLDLTDFGAATVDAEARLNLPDIGVFNRLLAELDNLEGQLQVDLAIQGQLSSPSLEGHARLSEGLIAHAPLGLVVSGIELNLDVENDEGQLTGRMQSGDGELRVTGRAHHDEAYWNYELTLNGEDFEFADIDWLRIQASPQLSVSRRNDHINLDGDIQITRLRAGMPPGTEGRVTESEDVRVVGEVDEVDEGFEQLLSGRLGILLGDDSRISAEGLQTQLTGGIELLWDPQVAMPRARGQIGLRNGSYRAYGQTLEVREGEILFTGHPLDNPRLNIRAVRDIFGDPQVDEAGVQIRGTAQNPVITLFTDPPTSEEKALAYVVTGADFDVAGGHGAVNLGFYLLPRLFVSYGIGLFEAGNVLSGRYELSRRWGVRVVSGERDTGVDLSFSIER
jgi:translocation and assembly module TamB